jgi:hypothetical protein
MKILHSSLLISVCLSACLGLRPFVANPSLLKQWSYELDEAYSYPYVAYFQKANVSLAFVASAHQYGIDSATFKTINRVADDFKPQVIIIEGVADQGKRDRVDALIDDCKKDDFKKCGENLYGIYLAKAAKIPWLTGEPPKALLRAQLASLGYSEEDIAFFYLAQQIRQLTMEKSLNDGNFDRVSTETLAYFARFYGLPHGLNADGFKRWYRQKMGKPFRLSEIDSETTAPLIGQSATYLNKISSADGKIRDVQILLAIAKELNRWNRVMVIYGGSHLTVQLDALKEMLGEPRFEKKF